ncbi:hypothetical protein ACFOEW_11530 [Alteromonas oceani]|uniref:DUF2971 domain-containing protein n=1 Tax=Alteromonas oceani TaxID=2071609 RepID=A0ABV7K244_9ALTE|nr:hypothetical protein [Alteromonas oceani]
MDFEKLVGYLSRGKLQKVHLVKNQRCVSGAIEYFNISIEAANGEITNFNVLKSNAVLFNYCLKVANEQGVEVRESNAEIESGYVIEDVGDMLPDESMLWRYMDFSKFLDLITSSCIWMCRMDILQATDPMEGRIPDSEFIALKSHLHAVNWAPVSYGNGKHVFGGQNTSLEPKMKSLTQAQIADSNYSLQEELEYHRPSNLYINCWHISEHENNAMWSIYGKVSNSLAIVTNYSALKKSFGADKNFKLHAGVVNYIDYENEGFKLPITSGRFGRVLTKERAYADERELRIFFEDHGMVNDLIDTTVPFDYFPSEELIKDYKQGVKPEVDLNILIERIIINPDADLEFVNKVKNTVGDLLPKLDPTKIVQSSLKAYKPQKPRPFDYP